MQNLPGLLAPAEGQLYAWTLTGDDGLVYALLGATPEVEAQLGALGALGSRVLVSGTLELQSPIAAIPLLVVESVAPAAAAPTPTSFLSIPETTPLGRQTPGTPAATPTGPTPTLSPGEFARATNTPTLAVVLVPTATPPVPPVPAPTAAVVVTVAPIQVAGPNATVTAFAVNVRKGPSGDYAFVGVLRRGAVCTVVGRSVEPDWLLLNCPTISGWVRAAYLDIDGPTGNLPLVSVPAPDTAAPELPATVEAPFRWRGLAYANRDLAGPPAVGFDTAVIDFNWGYEAPLAGLPVDNFSMRFDATPRFAPGDYLFSLTFDDGARLTINGDVVLNDWAEGAARTLFWQGRLAGDVPISVEYFEAFHVASVRLEIERLLPVPVATPAPPTPAAPGPLPNALLPQNEWIASYFANLALSGLPTLSRFEPPDDADAPPSLGARAPLNREYSLTSPAPAVLGLEGWSARWQGQFRFAAGAHRMELSGSGRAAVYLDNILIAAGDLTPAGDPLLAEISVSAGWHALAVEFADTLDAAAVRLAWVALDEIPFATPDVATPAPGATRTPTPTRAPGIPPLPTEAAPPATPAPTAAPTPTFPPGK